MLAVIEIGWNQYTVKVWDIIETDNQNMEIDSIIKTNALLISNLNWDNIQIWTPLLEKSNIELKVLNNFKWDKIRVFKMKSKKRYSRTKWFRPFMTKLEITSIT